MIDILIDPLIWMSIAFLTAILLALTLRRCARCAILLCALYFMLSAIASPIFANRWLGSLEDQYPSAACEEQASKLPTVVIAGGYTGGFSNLGRAQRLTNASKNRALAAAKIVPNQGILILSGGSTHPSLPNEAEAMEELIHPMLAKNVQLALETASTDTYSNAVYVGALMDKMKLNRDIVLVSSSWHLPRAVATFKRQGFNVCAHGVDPRQTSTDNWVSLLPRATAIPKTTLAIHEWSGILYYRHLDWI